MKTILTSTDFSVNGDNAVEYAAALSQEFQSKLILLNVNETFTKEKIDLETSGEEEILIAIDEKLTAIKNKIEKNYKNILVEKQVVNNSSAAFAIDEAARRRQADLVVIGCTGTNKFERLLMGSTSSKLIHISKHPVLCIPKGIKFEGIRKIVFATDLMEDNINAALSMVTFAKHFNAEICFLFVDDKKTIHKEESVSEITRKIRSRIHYPKLSGYITENTNVVKGLEYFLEKHETQILVMYSHEAQPSTSRFSQSNTSMMSEHIQIPLLALKEGVITLSGL